MKVLLVNKFFRPVGGPESVMTQTMRWLEANGHEVAVFSMDDEGNAETPWSKYFVSPIDYRNQKRSLRLKIKEAFDIFYSVEAERKIEQLLNDVHPDIAHLHNIYHQLTPSILKALKRHNVPAVMTLHDYKLICPNYTLLTEGRLCERCIKGAYYNAVLHNCVKGSRVASAICAVECYLHRAKGAYERNLDLFISPSMFLKGKMEQAGYTADKITYLPNTVDAFKYSPRYDDDGYILFYGKLVPEKGVLTLLKAIAEIPDRPPLVIAGRGDQREELERFAEKNNLHNVRFSGFLTGDELLNTIAGCKFFVMPSEWYENCPMTILEAFSFGKPVVATKIGGIPEFVEHGVNGMLYEPGDYKALAFCIQEMLKDPGRSREMGKAGREKMETELSVEEHHRRLMQIYGHIMKGSVMRESVVP